MSKRLDEMERTELYERIRKAERERDELAASNALMRKAISQLIDDESHQELPAKLWDFAGDAMRASPAASLARHDFDIFQREVKAVYRQWADDCVEWNAPEVFRALHIRLESMLEHVDAIERGES